MSVESEKSHKRSVPSSGMRVIELTHIMAGPACGLLLADMGADVIKNAMRMQRCYRGFTARLNSLLNLIAPYCVCSPSAP